MKLTCRAILFGLLLVTLAACAPTTPAAPAAPSSTTENTPTPDQPSPTPETAEPSPDVEPTSTLRPTSSPTPEPQVEQTDLPIPTAQPLAPFNAELDAPFAADVTLTTWGGAAYGGNDPALPVDLTQVDNPGVIDGLTGEQRAFLAENGFVILHTQEPQFGTIKGQMLRSGQPYYLTTDAALHSVHLDFDDALKALEREMLQPQMASIIAATLDEVMTYQPVLAGTPAEADGELAALYLAVALRLFDPDAPLDPALEAAIQPQIDQIMEYGGKQDSVLIPGFQDDYGAYRPVGHYAGDEGLEQYFRGMTWLGRVHFRLKPLPGELNFKPSRVPLIVTLALRRTQIDGAPASETWAEIHEVLTFMIGPSDDAGPLEYAALMDAVYGTEPAPDALADDALWAEFQRRADELPSPRINSIFLDWARELPDAVGWRFMGQRFTLDGYIFQQMVFNNVEERSPTERRDLPTGADLALVLGSPVGLEAVTATGKADYPNYLDQVERLQEEVQQRPQEDWLRRFYDAWLYAFLPVLAGKDASYPPYMQGDLWAYKDMNAMLGSWAELKHDTILYTKMPEGYGGGGPPRSGPPPGVVEPNPEAWYRMAYMVNALVAGLNERGIFGDYYAPDNSAEPGLGAILENMSETAEDLTMFGDIAAKELEGQPLTEDEYYAIVFSCMSMAECLPGQQGGPDPPPVVAAVAGGGESVLEAATGYVDRLYVVVAIDGQLTIAQGGVYSYYEFTQPRTDRLTDEAWRDRLASPDAPALPAWTSAFLLPGGEAAFVTAFRVGDVYSVTEEGAPVTLRGEPSAGAEVIAKIPSGTYFYLTEGPIVDDAGNRWWYIESVRSSEKGWVMEHPPWYERSS
jgi:hypothetical protein